MITSATKALELKKKYPDLSSEEIIKKVLVSFEPKLSENQQILGIASANEALNMRLNNLNFIDKQLLQKVMDKLEIIAKKGGFEEK